MNSAAYETLFRELGFTRVERGKKLLHRRSPPTIYFNREHDGFVYFTVYTKDQDRFDSDLWQRIAPRQKKDKSPQLITLVPLQGRELDAFISVLSRGANNSAIKRHEQEERAERRIRESTRLGPTQKKALILARRGQGAFRSNVMHRAGAICRVTGVNDPNFLRASHIKPWCKSNDAEKLDGANGLMLSPHIDHLFDQGYISFSDDGGLLVSGDAKEVARAWAVPVDRNVGAFNAEQAKYLAYHRREVYLG